MVFDPAGNLHDVVDSGHSRVRKINLQGIISTIAMKMESGYSETAAATSAALWTPGGIALDKASNLYIADYTNGRIRKVSPGGVITTVAGNGVFGYSGDGNPATSAPASPRRRRRGFDGSFIICDGGNYRIRRGFHYRHHHHHRRRWRPSLRGRRRYPATQASFSSPDGIALSIPMGAFTSPTATATTSASLSPTSPPSRPP
ncbi:MAG: hypothetical protein U0R19_11125 [Bryobacteraceae bacterium]